MNPAAKLLRALVAMLIMFGVAIVPALAPAAACTGMAPAAMDHDNEGAAKPELALRCDPACVACLVQPVPVQFASRGLWSVVFDYGAHTARLGDRTIKPDLPPPRIWLA